MPTVPTAIVTPDSSPTQTRPTNPTRQETSSTNRSLSFPANLGPRDGEKTSIPENHIFLIRKAFGREPDNEIHCDVDLYADVLQVDRCASPKDIRIAYFRRGREVLAFGKDRQLQRSGIAVLSPNSFNQVAITETAKLRFQAVSLAYEILSTPSWKRYYDKNGFPDITATTQCHNHSYDSPQRKATFRSSSVTPSSLRRSKKRSSDSTSRSPSVRRRSHSVGVRWNDNVEELIYCPQPEEINLYKDDGDNDDDDEEEKEYGDEIMDVENKKRGNKSSKKKSKKRILVETADDDLSIHLRKLDNEAGAFVTELLDQLEASLDDFMNLDADAPNPNIETDITNKALALEDMRCDPSEDEEDESSEGVEVVDREPKSFMAIEGINTAAVGNFMTDILDQVSSRFEQLLSYEEEDDKDDTTVELPLADKTASSSPSFLSKLVGTPVSQWRQEQHEKSTLVIGPVAEWGLPANPDVVTSPSPPVMGRRSPFSTSELISGPVAEWGRVNTSSPPPHVAQLAAMSTLAQGEQQMRRVRPMKIAQGSSEELDVPEDESSSPPPPMREVRKVNRLSLPNVSPIQESEDDMSSMSESHASSRLVNSRDWIQTQAQSTEATAKENFQGLGAASPKIYSDAVSDYNPTNPFNDDVESIVDAQRDHGNNFSALIASVCRLEPGYRITVHHVDHDGNECLDDGVGTICCGDTVGLSTITKATRNTSASTSSSCDSSRPNKSNDVLNFFHYLVSYLEEISTDLVECGYSAGKQSVKTMLDAVLITEDDLEGMMNILRCEMDKHQGQ